ncbi:hypothetical protein DERP_004930 [Dermatophagoides pteronyssinus]|uniref:Uncharacterized protein n=1 Tax=Dermatophagoides pteronyssinus TaxID=6956 RepID=A0ABQ8JSX5_DERPT|nr:hypothetical protein DERP_004930 [Dermatophagoides pteronyssinus]
MVFLPLPKALHLFILRDKQSVNENNKKIALSRLVFALAVVVEDVMTESSSGIGGHLPPID